MPFDDPSLPAGYGFSFEVPVPLPLLGHRAAYNAHQEAFPITLLLELNPVKPRAGGLSFDGGICYHDRDRFGLFAGSKIEIRIDRTPEQLVELGIYAILMSWERDGKMVHALGPGKRGLHLCVSLFNLLVDVQTAAFSSHWVPHVTPDDILELNLFDWSDPANPKGMGYIAGTEGNHKFKFGREAGFSSQDPERVRHILGNLPLELWEELIHAALRDFELGRQRSALMHSCLAVETYIRRVLELNPSPNRDVWFKERTLKQLVTKRGCLPALIGYSLESAAAPSDLREHYQRISALRDSIMHTGSLVYKWPPNESTYMSITSPGHVQAHLASALSIIYHISILIDSLGKNGGNRSMVPSPTDVMNLAD
jgi:hypothetical protein